MTGKRTIRALLLIIIILPVILAGNVFAENDGDIDINLDHVKQKNIDHKSDLDISQYDFFSTDNDIEREKINTGMEQSRATLFNGLFTGEMQSEEQPAEEKISTLQMFNQPIEYSLGNYDEKAEVNYKIIIPVLVFLGLGVLSFAAAISYTRFKRREKGVY